jgi:hypothetical protein
MRTRSVRNRNDTVADASLVVYAQRRKLQPIGDSARTAPRVAVAGVNEQERGADVDTLPVELRSDPREKAMTTVRRTDVETQSAGRIGVEEDGGHLTDPQAMNRARHTE